MRNIPVIVFILFCLPGLLQVANGTKSPSQFTDETTKVMVNLVEHEIVLTPIDSFLLSIEVK